MDEPISFHCMYQYFFYLLASCCLVIICYYFVEIRETVLVHVVLWLDLVYWLVLMVKTLYSHSASRHPGVQFTWYLVNSILRGQKRRFIHFLTKVMLLKPA